MHSTAPKNFDVKPPPAFLRSCRQHEVTLGLGIGNYWTYFQNTEKQTLKAEELTSEEVTTTNDGFMKVSHENKPNFHF